MTEVYFLLNKVLKGVTRMCLADAIGLIRENYSVNRLLLYLFYELLFINFEKEYSHYVFACEKNYKIILSFNISIQEHIRDNYSLKTVTFIFYFYF